MTPFFPRKSSFGPLGRLATMTALMAALLTATLGAHAATSAKVSADLAAMMAAPAGTTPSATWARNLDGVLHVKLLINASSTDAELSALRKDIVARGGSVTYNYLSVRALSAMLPASAVGAVAARTDVLGISPNRAVSRHAGKPGKTSTTSTTSTTLSKTTTSPS